MDSMVKRIMAKIKQAKLSLNMIAHLGVSFFGEDVWKLIKTLTVSRRYDSKFHLLKDMTINFNVLNSFMKTDFKAMWIVAWLSQGMMIGWGALILRRRALSHKSSYVVFVMARYSASALDLETIFYFLLFQVTRFTPTNV